MSHPIQLRRRARQRAKRRREERVSWALARVDASLAALAVLARNDSLFPGILRFPKVWGPPVLVP